MRTSAWPRPGRFAKRAAAVISQTAAGILTRPHMESFRQTSVPETEVSSPGSTWMSRQAGCGCLVGLAILLISLATHVAVAIPLEKRALGEQVRRIALETDAVLAERSSVLEMAVSSLRREKTTAAPDLDGLVRVLQSVWPDFLSLEVIDSQGEIIAMVGDLYLSDAGRPIHLDKPIHHVLATQQYHSIFRDDPERGFFSITVKQSAAAGETWFARARFSREPLEKLLISGGNGELLSVSGRSASWPKDASETVRTHQNWLGFPTGAEALLRTPNWMLRVERGSRCSWFLIVSGLVGAAMILICAPARILPRMAGRPARNAPAATATDDTPVVVTTAPSIVSCDAHPENGTHPQEKPPEEIRASEEVPEWLEVAWSEPENKDADRSRDSLAERYSGSAGA